MARIDFDSGIAASQHDALCEAELYYQLGLQSACGRDRPVDRVEAHKWFNVALLQGYKAAAERRAELALEMTRDEIAEALRQARAFITRH